MTQFVDPAGNAVTVDYDASLRVISLTDALGQVTTISYELPTDPLKITKVTEPFATGRYASFGYNANGQLVSITDEIGIESTFMYSDGADFITSMTTPYGTTNFATGQSGSRWVEMTDPLGGKERVEYRDGAPGIADSDPSDTVPSGFANSGLSVGNTFYWDKKSLEMYPPVNGVYDYTKAKIIHWAYKSDGSPSGIVASEKTALENRVWYAYVGQTDTNHVGTGGSPSQTARVLGDGSSQRWQFEYNSVGNKTKSSDPAGRAASYIYDVNNIDILEERQTTGTANELLRRFAYNS